MHRQEFRALSRLRLREARLLLRAGAFEGAYYLLGYAVECAIKACIAKRFSRHEVPERKVVNDFYTHDLRRLLELAKREESFELQIATVPELGRSWETVMEWKETARYNPIVSREKTFELFRACVSREHGILTWLRQ
jgi:HEPN domain-containing protein